MVKITSSTYNSIIPIPHPWQQSRSSPSTSTSTSTSAATFSLFKNSPRASEPRSGPMAVDSAKDALKADKSVSSPPVSKPTKNREDEIREVARKFAEQPVQISDAAAWGILTAICKLSRKRPQVTLLSLSLSRHCLCTLNPIPNPNAIFLDGSRILLFEMMAPG